MRKTQSYRCDRCRDLTFIVVGDVATPCECRELRHAESILKQSGISDEFRKKTFDSFNYSYDIQTIDAYGKASRYYSNFKSIIGNRRNSIMFLGQVGSGKTHLSLAIANKLMDNEAYDRVMSRYKRAKVLLIDDLFKGNISKSDVNIIFEIVNFRYFNSMPMIISCEKSVENLLDIDESIGSRLVEMSKDYFVEMKGSKLNYRVYG